MDFSNTILFTDLNISSSFIQSTYSLNHYSVIGLYVPVFLVSFVANVLVILVVFKDKYMRSVTNYFLVNLSTADLLVTLVCMPNAAWRAHTIIYNFGTLTCKISAYLQSAAVNNCSTSEINAETSTKEGQKKNKAIETRWDKMSIAVASSIFTITAMAIDRYITITKPFGLVYKCFNKTTAIIVIICLWVTSFFLFSPILWIYTLKVDVYILKDENITAAVCIEEWTNFAISQHTLGVVWFTLMFAVPGVIMLFAYSMMGRTLCSGMPLFDNNEATHSQQRCKVMRSRKRVACILLLLALTFAACWLPYNIMNLIRDTGNYESTSELFVEAKVYLLLLGHANSALNPMICCALSRKFRRSINNLFRIRTPFRRRQQWTNSASFGTQLHYLHRPKSVPTIENPLYVTFC